jgi:2-C-methyl-D-erythritol 4-phosphate cytidylyltransferase
VLSERNIQSAKNLIESKGYKKEIVTCPGGKRRQDSVLAGFNTLADCDWIVIHDAARPLVTVDLIERGIVAACETGAVVASIPATDTVKLVDENGFVRWTPERDKLYLCQTPQVFYRELLELAFRYVEHDVTDEAQLVELSGGAVKIYQGAYDNIKITTPADLAIARVLWRQRKA